MWYVHVHVHDTLVLYIRHIHSCSFRLADSSLFTQVSSFVPQLYSGTSEMDSLYYEASTMGTKGCGPKIIPYSLLYKAETSLHRIMDFKLQTLKSRPNGQNQYKFPSEADSLDLLVYKS